MELTTTHRLFAPAARVFAAINDSGLLGRCVGGCEKVARTGENTYDAHVRFGSSPFRGQVVVKLEFRETNPPESITLLLEGNTTPGQVQATARIRLADRESECDLQCQLLLRVKGMIALLGSRRIESTARKWLDQFFAKFSEELARSTDSAQTDQSTVRPMQADRFVIGVAADQDVRRVC